MDKKNQDLAKNILAGVGTFAVIKAVPVLAVGAAVGAALANPEKTKKVVKDFANNVGEKVADFKANMEARMEEDMNMAGCECDVGEDECCECGEENTIFDEAEPVVEDAEQAPESATEQDPVCAKRVKAEALANAFLNFMAED